MSVGDSPPRARAARARSRALLALALAAGLLAAFAALALAGEGDPPEVPGPSGLSSDDRDKLKERKRAEARERERKRRDPRERAERLRSASAYTDAKVDSDAALTLFTDTFGEDVLEALGDEPIAGPGERLVRYLSDQAALVEGRDGKTRILESPMLPLLDAGREEIDLELEEESGEFTPEDTATALRLPEELSEGIELPEEGITITPAGAEGSDPEGRESGEGIAWPKFARDTDFLAVPTPTGVQLMAQLRSARSPEQLELDVELPDGAELKELRRGEAGAQVVKDGKPIADISPPLTLDADGEEVATELRVKDGERIVLRVAHRDSAARYRYPLQLDPVVTSNWWYSGADRSGPTAHWQSSTSPSSRFLMRATEAYGYCYRDPAQAAQNPDCRGLYIFSNGNTNYSAGNHAMWYWERQGGPTSYIERADFLSMSRSDRGENVPRPDLYFGIFSAAGWLGYDARFSEFTNHYEVVTPGRNVAGGAGAKSARYATFQLYFDEGGHRDHRVVTYLGGAHLYVSDPEAPSVPTLTHQDLPRWKSGGSATTTASASDPGLGVYAFRLTTPQGTAAPERVSPQCEGTKQAPCPPSASRAFTYSVDAVPEGVHDYKATALDPLHDKGERIAHESGARQWAVRVDRSGPEIAAPSGTAVEGWRGSGQSLMRVEATDESASGPRAGVRQMQVRVNEATDGQGQPQYRHDFTRAEADCDSCPLARDFALTDADLQEGVNQVDVRATDYAGNVTERRVEVKADREGPTLAVAGTLKEANGQAVADNGGRLGGGRYTLDVNVTDGALTTPRSGAKSVEILVDDVRRDYAEQLCPLGSCPMSRSWAFDTKDYEVGRHRITVRTTDQVGNLTEELIEVNVDPLTGDLPRYQFETYELPGKTELKVNVANGNLLLRQNEYDVDITDDTNQQYSLDRFYNSLSNRATPTGVGGWVLGLGRDVRLTFPTPGTVRLEGPSGLNLPFVEGSGGTFESPEGYNYVLSRLPGSGYALSGTRRDERLEFDAQGNLLTQIDEAESRIDYEYEDGLLSSIDDDEDRTFEYDYDDEGRIETMTDPDGGVHLYTHDAAGLKSYEAPDGGKTELFYDPLSGKLNRIKYTKDGSSEETRITYEPDTQKVHSIIRNADPITGEGDEATYDYDGATTTSASSEREASYTRDGSGMVTESTEGEDPPDLDLSGALYAARGTTLDDDEYDLGASATASSDSAGVPEVTMSVDKLEDESVEQDCDEACGDLEADFDLATNEATEGEYVVRMQAIEKEGDTHTKTFRFSMPREPLYEEVTENPDDAFPPTVANEGPAGSSARFALGARGARGFKAFDRTPCFERFGRTSKACEPRDALAEDAPGTGTDRRSPELRTREAVLHDNVFTRPIAGSTGDLVFGLGGEQTEQYQSSSFPSEVRTVKRIVPWNLASLPPGTRARDQWDSFYQFVTTQHPDWQIIVAFETEARGSGPRPRPMGVPGQSIGYIDQLQAFRSAYPGVAAYSAWNEPNNPFQPFDSRSDRGNDKAPHHGPGYAALYTHYAQRALCNGDCAIIAGDFAQYEPRKMGDSVIRYANAYKRKLASLNGSRGMPIPRVWGFHPYGDVAASSIRSKPSVKTTTTRRLLRVLPRGSRLWFTEIGSYITQRGGEKNSERSQASEVSYLVSRLAIQRGIDRVYYYFHCTQTPERDDTGLTRTGTCNPRPSRGIYRGAVNDGREYENDPLAPDVDPPPPST